MKIKPGKGATQDGPGVSIELTGDEVAAAIEAWIAAQGVRADMCMRTRVALSSQRAKRYVAAGLAASRPI